MAVIDTDTGAGREDPGQAGRTALERELYWASEPTPPDAGRAGELRRGWAEVAERLRLQADHAAPVSDPGLAAGSRWRRLVKRVLFRLMRPVSRRSDRMGAELAELGLIAARRLETLENTAEAMQLAVGALRADVAELQALAGVRLGTGAGVPDDFYWRFEEFMRGDAEVLVASLRQYENLARGLLRDGDWGEAPLWLDVGCGRGEFALLLEDWGWRVKGVDTSVEAVDACRALGIQAEQADGVSYLATYTGEPLGAVSGIQLVEHLPREVWLRFLSSAYTALRDRGGLLLETINPLNVRALAGSFFADLSHSWPGHPHTLRLMAESVGFSRVEILWLNPDGEGEAQDFAIWAVKG